VTIHRWDKRNKTLLGKNRNLQDCFQKIRQHALGAIKRWCAKTIPSLIYQKLKAKKIKNSCFRVEEAIPEKSGPKDSYYVGGGGNTPHGNSR